MKTRVSTRQITEMFCNLLEAKMKENGETAQIIGGNIDSHWIECHLSEPIMVSAIACLQAKNETKATTFARWPGVVRFYWGNYENA